LSTGKLGAEADEYKINIFPFRSLFRVSGKCIAVVSSAIRIEMVIGKTAASNG